MIKPFLRNAIPKRERNLSFYLYLNMALLNHSCAPNADVGELLESFERDDDGRPYKRIEIRAIKDISKGEEVTEYYMTKGMMTKSQRREIILGAFSFDCKCSVCVGLISDQDGIISEIVSINAKRCLNLTYQMKTEDWMTEALKFERAADLTRKLDVGHILDRISVIMNFVRVSQMARDPTRLKKALGILKEEIDAAGLKEECRGKCQCAAAGPTRPAAPGWSARQRRPP